MIKTKNFNISEHIKTHYRNYALYTLMHRGIPNFEDGLTNVQRMIILNTSSSFTKTMSVVGNVIADGYHHGDASPSKAASKLARPFGCSAQILDGSGFMGNSVNPEASSPRYTSIALNKDVAKYISKFKHLNERSMDEVYLPLNLELPIGLFTTIIGIAVGYKTTILPRKPQDILGFLDGKKKNVPPFIQGFEGKITTYDGLANSWLFEGICVIDEDKKTISVKSIPPLMSYKNFVSRLNRTLEYYKVKVDNYTKEVVDIKINFDTKEELKLAKDQIINLTKQIVRENIVFIKDDRVLEYDSIEDYLTDFKRHRIFVESKDCSYQIKYYQKESEFLLAKKEFMIFLKTIKGFYAKDKIDEFIDKFEPQISERLDRLQLRSLNKDEIDNIPIKVEEYKKLIGSYSETYNKKLEELETLGEKLHTKKYLTENYEIDENSDIEIFNLTEEKIDGDITED